MPQSASDLFGQIGASQSPQTFSQFLQPRPIDTAPPAGQSATGWETPGVGAGDIALSFLQGVRQNRVAKFQEDETNNEAALNNYRQYVNQKLQDPDLTDEGRQKILDQANDTLNRHMHYELRDTPKEGVAGFFKNLLVNASGGPIKTREPVDFQRERGAISEAAAGYSQKANLSKAVAEAQQTVDQLKRSNPNLSAEEVQQALLPTFYKVMQSAPNYADAFAKTMGMGYPSAGSVQYGLNELARTAPQGAPAEVPATQPPPGVAAPAPSPVVTRLGPGAGVAVSVPAISMGQPLPSNDIHPVDTGATAPPPGMAAAGGIEYEPGYDSRRFAALSNVAGQPRSPINIDRPALVTTGGGKRVMAVQVMGSTHPMDNGYWDAQTGQKIKGPVTKESLEGASMRVGEDGVVRAWNPESGAWEVTYTTDSTGKRIPMVQSYAPQGVYDSSTGQYSFASRAGSLSPGKAPAAVGLQGQRIGEDRAQRRADAVAAADNRLQSRNLETTRTADQTKNGILSGNINIVTSGLSSLGIPVDPATIQQAMKNPQPLLDSIDKQVKERTAANQSAWQQERATVEENFPAQVRRTAPPPAAPRPAPAKPAPAQAAPAGRKVVKGIGSL